MSGSGHASSLQLVLSKETRESMSERCLSNNQKGEVGCQQLSTDTQITGQRFSPWTSAVTHVCAKHITVWPHPQHYSEAWRQKVRPYRVDLRSAWSAAPVGTSWHPTELDIAGIRDKWGPNLGNGSQHLWHTHTLVRRDNFPFTILQLYLHLFRFFMNICV